MATLHNAHLCDSCRGISLQALLGTKKGDRSKDMAGKLVRSFRPESGCPLCNLVWNAAVRRRDSDTEEGEEGTGVLATNIWVSTKRPAELSFYVHGRSLADFSIRISADEGCVKTFHESCADALTSCRDNCRRVDFRTPDSTGRLGASTITAHDNKSMGRRLQTRSYRVQFGHIQYCHSRRAGASHSSLGCRAIDAANSPNTNPSDGIRGQVSAIRGFESLLGR